MADPLLLTMLMLSIVREGVCTLWTKCGQKANENPLGVVANCP